MPRNKPIMRLAYDEKTTIYTKIALKKISFVLTPGIREMVYFKHRLFISLDGFGLIN
jgi:hypothetical protein